MKYIMVHLYQATSTDITLQAAAVNTHTYMYKVNKQGLVFLGYAVCNQCIYILLVYFNGILVTYTITYNEATYSRLGFSQ